ncbi:DMT family transporter [Neptunomonas sp.]|uniref:DMT family transporter n=1 Tax=Neptunomonas sp. TaxID=1971898 RepID=UPI0025F373E7|nr:DMT family transporter [Neptunomonas sp.]
MILAFVARFPISVRYMLLSALGFALMAACVKAVSAYGIPVLEIVAARALVSLVISYFDIHRKKISVWGNNRLLLLARGVVGTLALICVFFAVTTLPLTEATFLQYTYPAFTAVIALFFLKERINLSTIVCISLSLIGLMIIVQPGLSVGGVAALPLLSIVAALIGAFGSAVAYVLVRRLSQSEDSSVIIFYFPLIALPISILLLRDGFIIPGLIESVLLILVGIFTQIGQVGITKAMSSDTAGKVAGYSYIQVVFAAVLGLVFFDELPSLWTMIGGCFIVAGAFINAMWKR